MSTIIMPLPKCPFPKRIGRVEYSDWYQGCKRAVDLQLSFTQSESEILVLTNARYNGSAHEADVYSSTLNNLGGRNIQVIRECYETTEQLDRAIEIARLVKKDLIVVSTWLHYPRAAWILRGTGTEHHVAFGIPNFKYAVFDIILNLVFPIIDLVPGWRAKFVDWIKRKRKAGRYY